LAASVSAECCVPTITPGGKPVIEEPGETPRSPAITLGPVFVTVEPARIAKSAAEPIAGAVPVALIIGSKINDEPNKTANSNSTVRLRRIIMVFCDSVCIL
jgi:hypothetical protein